MDFNRARILEKVKPAVSKRVLVILAWFIWFSVGIMLASMAFRWLYLYKGSPWIYAIIGFTISFFICHYGFLKIVNKNLRRIARLPNKRCLFSFIPWKSYLIIAIMVTLGITLRHSPVPKQCLSVIYLGIGLALFLSSTRYLVRKR